MISCLCLVITKSAEIACDGDFLEQKFLLEICDVISKTINGRPLKG